MKKKLPFILFVLVLTLFTKNNLAQIGGDNVYEFLNMPASARVGALGDNFLASKDNDITLTLTNPSLITREMDNHLSLSFIDFFSDINYGFAMYSKTFKNVGSFVGTMQFIDYGTFTYADPTGQTYGDFSVSEYALNIGWGRELDSSFSIGANFKTIYSALEDYTSLGLAVDVAGSYFNAKKNLTLSLIIKNAGIQLTNYYGSHREPLPFEMQLGFSQKLKHLPFRYFINYNHIEKWDLTYVNPNDPNHYDPFTGEIISKTWVEGFVDKLMRHIVIGGELTLANVVSLRLSYNYQRRQELKITEKPGGVGLSWGVGIQVSKFNFGYARSTYHQAGSPNYFTLTTNLSDFFMKNRN